MPQVNRSEEAAKMGLDGVALVLDWEERFGIEIPDAAAAQLETPRQAIDYIYGVLRREGASVCLTQRAFYRVRSSLAANLAAVEGRVSPRTRLEDILPQSGRRASWAEISTAARLTRWPGLVRSDRLSGFLWAAALLAGTSSYLFLRASLGIALTLAMVSLVAGFVLTRPRAVHFPRQMPTMGGLARSLALYNPAELVPEDASWTRGQVRDIVRSSISEQLGVRPDFDEHAHFVRDLGLD